MSPSQASEPPTPPPRGYQSVDSAELKVLTNGLQRLKSLKYLHYTAVSARFSTGAECCTEALTRFDCLLQRLEYAQRDLDLSD